ncbi:cysteine peptidase family C39 domain-containing protein [Paenibacillus kobensis]|uniref:hypothetical protein n=1 Tax=Paenibacillus kobensis TaxID=59841 RepID=UPI000FD971DE|nr:hypothetical protein [Paenibacillus kobensis]
MVTHLLTPPIIDSLPQYSYPLSILSDPAQYETFIIDHFINLKADNYNNEVAVLDYCENSFLTFSMFEESSLQCYRADVTDEITDFVISKLEEGYCVFLHVDEIYLSFSIAYKTRNFGHGIMVHGYSKEDSVFYVAGYNQNNKLSSHDVPFVDLAQSYNHMGKVLEQNRQVEYLSKVFLIKNNHKKHAADVLLLTNAISDYRQSINTVHHYPRDYDTECETVFGLDIYDLLISHFTLAMEKDIMLLLKNSYLLAEHKRMMSLRLKLLAKQEGLDLTVIQEQYTSIERMSDQLLMLHIKGQLTNDKRVIPKIVHLLEEIKREETKALDSLIAVLPLIRS